MVVAPAVLEKVTEIPEKLRKEIEETAQRKLLEKMGFLLPRAQWPEANHLVTENDDPVDNLYSEKQGRFLAHTAHNWKGPGGNRSFIAMENVGLFSTNKEPAIVPDVMLSIDVELPKDIWNNRGRSYMIWEYGKPPDVVIEIVSNKIGGEEDEKKAKYASMNIPYYVVYDPLKQINDESLYIYELRHKSYIPLQGFWMPGVGLGLKLWEGKFEDREDTWLRWCDQDGNILPTSEERTAQVEKHANRLAAKLRELGIDPDGI